MNSPQSVKDLGKEEQQEFLKFCKRQYEQNNNGIRLTLPLKYANTHFDELYAQFQDSMPVEAKIRANTKEAQEAERIIREVQRDEWPNWVNQYR